MLGIKKALETFKANTNDPYVILEGTNIELRFGVAGEIVAAYNADVKPPIRWYSQAFRATLNIKDRNYGGTV